MGCTSSSLEGSGAPPAPTFEEAEAQLKKTMRDQLARNFPLSQQEAISTLRFSRGLQSCREVIQRSPPGCYQGTECLLECVHACTHEKEYLQQDVANLVELIDMLVAKGGDVNLIGNKAASPWSGVVPLHIVASQSRAHPGICLALGKALLQQPSLDVNIKTATPEANSAAHIAALLAQDSLMALLQPKANLDLTNAAGQTVHVALALGASRLLKEQTASAKRICEAAARGDTTVDLDRALSFLRAHGHNFAGDGGIHAESGMTLLGLAAAHGSFAKTFASLLRAGCDPGQADSFGKLPAFYLSDRQEAYRGQIEELLSRHQLPTPPISPSSSTASR